MHCPTVLRPKLFNARKLTQCFHLVRIPFDRALDFANKEKITEMLYPLFVHNIGALLYHPTNSNRTNAAMAAAERRKLVDNSKQPQGVLGPPGSQPPSLHHHHSMTNPIGSHITSPHSIAPHPGSRPNLDRAHTFPTPPTSASSGVGMGNPGGSYEPWGQGMGGSVQSTQPLAIDTHAHSTPSTPIATPPGQSIQTMQSYSSQPPYDSSRPIYSSGTSQQTSYTPQPTVQSQGMGRLSGPLQSGAFLKHEMGPPARAQGTVTEIEESGDSKANSYSHNPANEHVSHGTGEEEAEHEHDAEYAHDANAGYNSNRGSYSAYNSGSTLGSLHGEHPHLSPEMNGSPSQPNGSGRATPRTTTGGSQPQWAPGYHSPPRTVASSSHYNVISDTRANVSSGGSAPDTYAPAPLPSTYAPSHVNGTNSSSKRIREEDEPDQQSRPASRGDDIENLKRRKLGREGSVSGPVSGTSFDRDGRPVNRVKNPITQRTRR